MSAYTHDVPFYVQIHRSAYYNGRTVRAVRLTQSRPTVTDPDTVVVRLTVRIPQGVFDPIRPEAVIEIPADLVQHTVRVTAEDANP